MGEIPLTVGGSRDSSCFRQWVLQWQCWRLETWHKWLKDALTQLKEENVDEKMKREICNQLQQRIAEFERVQQEEQQRELSSRATGERSSSSFFIVDLREEKGRDEGLAGRDATANARTHR